MAPTTPSAMGGSGQAAMTDAAPADIASAGDVVSPSASSRPPTTRARRFLVDHPDDRTFERTMRHFLPGKDDPPRRRGVDRDDPGG